MKKNSQQTKLCQITMVDYYAIYFDFVFYIKFIEFKPMIKNFPEKINLYSE